MPCGGIYPVKKHFSKESFKEDQAVPCFSCNQTVKYEEDASFVEEWDAFIHRSCILPFLSTPEGQIVISHGHVVCFGDEI